MSLNTKPLAALARPESDRKALLDALMNDTKDHRAAYVARAEEIYMAGLVNMREALAKAGMDLNRVAPYPNSNMGGRQYRTMLGVHKRYTASFETVKHNLNLSARLSGKEPWPVVEKPDAESRVRQAARADANACFDSFLYKMAGKINEAAGPDEKIWGATLRGVIWDGCTLTVTRSLQTGTRFDPMESLVFTTRCIINQSVYGKLFNQWPTRRLV